MVWQSGWRYYIFYRAGNHNCVKLQVINTVHCLTKSKIVNHKSKIVKRICLFPGTFDPVTLGHVDIINRSVNLFDKIIVGIGKNNSKGPMFSAEQRRDWIKEIYKNEPRVESTIYDGLTIDYCKTIGAQFILRGIRYVSDFEYEKTIADANRAMDASIETIFLTGEPKYTSVASTIVRDIIRNGGNASPFLPEVVIGGLKKTKN